MVDAIVEAAKSGRVVATTEPVLRPTDETTQNMKICMLGSGALGSALGGVLTEGGNDVWLIDAWAGHVDAMTSRGLTLRVGGVDRTVKVKARTSPDGIGPADLVVVLVKSYHTREAIEKAGAIIGPDTVVMSLQNGLGHEEILADVVGKQHVLAGKTYAGGVLLGPGHVIAGTKDKYTYIGELDGRITERATRIAETFTRAGLPTEVSANIMGTMWDKLLINVATGALAGITRLPYGGLYTRARGRGSARSPRSRKASRSPRRSA